MDTYIMYIQIGVQDVHPISLYIINILWKDQPIKKNNNPLYFLYLIQTKSVYVILCYLSV